MWVKYIHSVKCPGSESIVPYPRWLLSLLTYNPLTLTKCYWHIHNHYSACGSAMLNPQPTQVITAFMFIPTDRIIIETANDRIDGAIERWNHVCLKRRLRDDSYTNTGRYMIVDKMGFDIVVGKYLVHDSNGIPTMAHRTNGIWTMQWGLAWDDRDTVS